MAATDLAAAMQRVDTVLRRRPDIGLSEDSLATARWQGDGHVVIHHPNGSSVATDLPAELGGAGALPTSGWLLRASVASCTASCIAMWAAAEGIALAALDVQVTSRSDARGLLGHVEADGRAISPGPLALRMQVRIAAPGVTAERLHALVEKANRLAPMSAALREAVPFELAVAVGAG